MMATMNSQMSMPSAPQMSRGRRPKRSMDQNDTGVEHTLTRVVISEMRNALLMVPSDLKKTVPLERQPRLET
jgi:hypothetical protein